MKEDVLEQIVDDYLQFRGYFTTHNVRFKPRRDHPEYERNQDSVPSDIDVVGYHPKLLAPERVVVVSCKEWQGGFDGVGRLAQLRGDRRNPSGLCGGLIASCGYRSGPRRSAPRSTS